MYLSCCTSFLPKLKEHDWKIRSTKVDVGNLKHELLNRLWSTLAVNVLKPFIPVNIEGKMYCIWQRWPARQVYLFIHPFATSIALGQVKQVLNTKAMLHHKQFYKNCKNQLTDLYPWLTNCTSVNITILPYFLLILPHHLQVIFNRISALTWTDITLQVCETSFSMEPISLLF
jgi:hypothetical protein